MKNTVYNVAIHNLADGAVKCTANYSREDIAQKSYNKMRRIFSHSMLGMRISFRKCKLQNDGTLDVIKTIATKVI